MFGLGLVKRVLVAPFADKSGPNLGRLRLPNSSDEF